MIRGRALLSPLEADLALGPLSPAPPASGTPVCAVSGQEHRALLPAGTSPQCFPDLPGQTPATLPGYKQSNHSPAQGLRDPQWS